MAFRPPKKQPEFASLKASLAQVGERDNALYQTIKQLIERLMQFQGITVEQAADVNNSINEINTIINIVADKNRTYLTELDESLNLPHSRQHLAGTYIAFDDTVANKRTVNVSLPSALPGHSTDDWEVLTNGDATNPEPIYGDGDVIMCHTLGS